MNFVASKLLLGNVMGLDDGGFMMLVVAMLLLVSSIGLGLAVVFRDFSPPIPPVEKPLSASGQASAADASDLKANAEGIAIGTGVGCEQHSASEKVVNEAFAEVAKELSADEQEALRAAGNPVH